MLNKEKTEAIINNIMKDNLALSTPLEIEWFDSVAQIEQDDVWCRFLHTDLDTKELRGLTEHFDVYISAVDTRLSYHNDPDSKLKSLYDDMLKSEGIHMFEVQITEKQT